MPLIHSTSRKPSSENFRLRRLQESGWIAKLRRGFYLTVDPEYREIGALPATAWIDDLMKLHSASYCASLLSSASLHWAAHQQPRDRLKTL